jgi:hypothetical protein
MTIKRLSSLMMFLGFVLFSYALANAQETKATTTTTSTNPRVVVTDNLAKPAAASTAETAKPATSTKTIGKYSVNVTEGVTAMAAPSPESGKYYNVTKWDGTKWVTKREFVPNKSTAAKPN